MSVKDLTEQLEVSPATIRRDIAKLHNLGRVRKVFGGIAPSNDSVSQRLAARPFEANRILHIERKEAIAVEAEKLCNDGDKLIVNGGSTCFQFAKRLGYRNLSIFTNSMPLASALYEHGVCNLVIAGGETSGAVVDRLGLKAFLIGPEIAPGVPALFTVGGAARMGLALKSGNFGGVTFFADALGVIR